MHEVQHLRDDVPGGVVIIQDIKAVLPGRMAGQLHPCAGGAGIPIKPVDACIGDRIIQAGPGDEERRESGGLIL